MIFLNHACKIIYTKILYILIYLGYYTQQYLNLYICAYLRCISFRNKTITMDPNIFDGHYFANGTIQTRRLTDTDCRHLQSNEFTYMTSENKVTIVSFTFNEFMIILRLCFHYYFTTFSFVFVKILIYN